MVGNEDLPICNESAVANAALIQRRESKHADPSYESSL